MTINYTTNLSLAEPVTGTESGTWGDDVNKGLTDYLDISIAGTLALTSASFTANALTLANTTGSSSSNGITTTTAQYYILKLSSLAAAVTITAPSSSKTYLVYNSDSTYSATIKASGQSGVSVVAGERALVFFNGTDYVKASSTVLTNFTGVLTGTYGGTGINNGSNTITIAGNLTHAGAFTQSFTASANTAVTLPAGATAASNNLLSSATAVAIVTGTPSSTTYLRGDGTWATISTTSGTVTSVAMTVPSFLSVSGSPITSSGTLAVTLSGTALPIANGGTGSTSTTFVSLTTNVTGTLPIANGGTNSTATATAGGVGYGTGTAHAYTAAGTSGQVLTSAGSGAPTWSTPSAGAMTLLNTLTASSSATLSDTTNLTSTYDLYMFEFQNIAPATDSQPFYIRVSTDGGSSYLTSGYIANSSNLGSSYGFDSNTSAINIGGATSLTDNIVNAAAYGLSGISYLIVPSSTTVRKYVWGSGAYYGYNAVGGTTLNQYEHAGMYNSNTAINAIQFLFASGNILSGKIRIYGIKTS